MKYRTRPFSRPELRTMALTVRALFAREDEMLDIVGVLERTVARNGRWHIEIVPKSALSPDKHAVTVYSECVIRIREDVYVGACKGRGRDRMTVAHEFVHFLLHTCMPLKQCADDERIPAYKDPEWQAKCFAGELLIPFPAIAGMSAEEIVAKYGVSEEAARYALRKA